MEKSLEVRLKEAEDKLIACRRLVEKWQKDLWCSYDLGCARELLEVLDGMPPQDPCLTCKRVLIDHEDEIIHGNPIDIDASFREKSQK